MSVQWSTIPAPPLSLPLSRDAVERLTETRCQACGYVRTVEGWNNDCATCMAEAERIDEEWWDSLDRDCPGCGMPCSPHMGVYVCSGCHAWWEVL